MDFSILTDDQLLLLLKGAMQEAINRGGAVKLAAENEVISAQERAAIEFRVVEKLRLEEAEKQRKKIEQEAEAKFREEQQKQTVEKIASTWEIKAAAITAIREWGYDDSFYLSIWSRNADRRIYFQNEKGVHPKWSWCYYITGNNNNPPGFLEGKGIDCWFDDKREALCLFFKEIARDWKGDISIPDDVGDVEASQKHLQRYLAAIRKREK